MNRQKNASFFGGWRDRVREGSPVACTFNDFKEANMQLLEIISSQLWEPGLCGTETRIGESSGVEFYDSYIFMTTISHLQCYLATRILHFENIIKILMFKP